MRTNDLLIEAEPLLREQIADHYDYVASFANGTHNARLLQEWRLSLFETLSTHDGEVTEIFLDPDLRREFIATVNHQLEEPGRRIQSAIPLEKILEDDEDPNIGRFIGTFEDPIDAIEPEVVVPQQQVFPISASDLSATIPASLYPLYRTLCITGPEETLGVNGNKHETLELIRSEMQRIRAILGQGYKRKHFDIRTAYAESIAILYEQVRTGKINSWRALTRGHKSFFDWNLNFSEVVRHVTTEYILPHYACSLNDLPLQNGFHEVLHRYNLRIHSKLKELGVRGLFLAGFPEMQPSLDNIARAHWHPARWPITNTYLTNQQKDENYLFLRRYIFEYGLSCRTKDDVIAVLDEETRLRAILKEERIPDKKKIGTKHVLYELVRDMPGEMYDIKPWEVKHMPHSTFRNPDGTPNKDAIAGYFQWADDKYGLALSLSPTGPNVHIPHIKTIANIGLSAEELRELFPKGKCLWGYEGSMPRFTWVLQKGTPNMPNIRSYLRYVSETVGHLPRTSHDNEGMRKIPHFTGFYVSGCLSFPRIRQLYAEVTAK